MPRDWGEVDYARVYHAALRRDHPAVWRDKATLGWWLTLLALAEDAYPAPAPLPRTIPDGTLAFLVADEVVDMADDESFVFHGLDAERAYRNDEVSRGYHGGLIRAQTGRRDRLGRYVPGTLVNGAGPDAGHSRSDAGTTTLDPTLADDAGQTTLDASVSTQTRQDKTRTESVPTAHTLSPSESPSARGRASADPAGSPPDPAGIGVARTEVGGGKYGPPRSPTCRDPDAHGSSQRYYAGVGWKCRLCDVEQPGAKSFRERARDAGADL